MISQRMRQHTTSLAHHHDLSQWGHFSLVVLTDMATYHASLRDEQTTLKHTHWQHIEPHDYDSRPEGKNSKAKSRTKRT
eukprot:5754472-Amphidinium_carterae.1